MKTKFCVKKKQLLLIAGHFGISLIGKHIYL